MCLSFCPQGGVCIQGGLDRPPSDTTGYGRRAGGTHPTGMHYCILVYLVTTLCNRPTEKKFTELFITLPIALGRLHYGSEGTWPYSGVLCQVERFWWRRRFVGTRSQLEERTGGHRRLLEKQNPSEGKTCSTFWYLQCHQVPYIYDTIEMDRIRKKAIVIKSLHNNSELGSCIDPVISKNCCTHSQARETFSIWLVFI